MSNDPYDLWMKLQTDLNTELTHEELGILQKSEIDALNQIYNKELKILKSTTPFKFQIEINPFLEIRNLIVPGSYPSPYVTLIVEFTDRYPFFMPHIKLYSNKADILKRDEFRDLETRYTTFTENPSRTFIVYELIERIRGYLYNYLKNEYPDFRRIRHFMDDEVSEDYETIHQETFDHIENLKKKDTFTPLTAESFNEWNNKFMTEMARNERKVKDVFKGKLTGREIFTDISGNVFVDEGDIDADAEVFEFDADAFEDEEFEIDMDELLENN